MPYDSELPYDDLPTLPPPVDVESKAVLKRCLTATRALAELKGAGGLIPDQSILINAIPLQEARTSCAQEPNDRPDLLYTAYWRSRPYQETAEP